MQQMGAVHCVLHHSVPFVGRNTYCWPWYCSESAHLKCLRTSLHSDFAFVGLEADRFAPDLDNPPNAVLHEEFTDRKNLPPTVFPPELGFKSGPSD